MGPLLRFCHRAVLQVSARARVPSESHGAPSAAVGRVRFFMGLLTEGLSFSLWGSKEALSKQAGG